MEALGSVLTSMLSEDPPRRPRKASKLNNMMKFSIFGLLRTCLGSILEALGGVLEAFALEPSERFLKASWRPWNAFQGLLKSSWRPCWIEIAPRRPREAETLKNIKRQTVFQALLEASWSVLEGLEGVLKAPRHLGCQDEPRWTQNGRKTKKI